MREISAGRCSYRYRAGVRGGLEEQLSAEGAGASGGLYTVSWRGTRLRSGRAAARGLVRRISRGRFKACVGAI